MAPGVQEQDGLFTLRAVGHFSRRSQQNPRRKRQTGRALGDWALSPESSPQGVRVNALSDGKGCRPGGQDLQGSHGGSCLAGSQLPKTWVLAWTPLSFQGSLSHW